MRAYEDKSAYPGAAATDESTRLPQPAWKVRAAELCAWDSFARWSHYGLIAFCLFVPLSIALAQLAVVPILLYWVATLLVERSRSGAASLSLAPPAAQGKLCFGSIRRFSVPLVVWLYIALASGLVGLNWLRSLGAVPKTALYLLFPLSIVTSLCAGSGSPKDKLARMRMYLLALFAGQTAAALHTIVSAAIGYEIPPRIPGPVTESGQLVLTIPMLIGMVFTAGEQQGRSPVQRKAFLFGTLLFLSLVVCAWPHLLNAALPDRFSPLAQPLMALTAVATAAALLLSLRSAVRSGSTAAANLWYVTFCAAFLLATLLVNLKRGPWLGVFVELVVLGAFLSRKLLFSTCVFSAFFLLALGPARDRLASLASHFVIEGGRLSMWTLGMELVGRYPLGIGLSNVRYMRTFDPSLPDLHRHMHNNFLNVAVETGWLGLVAFLWWIGVAIGLGFVVWRTLPPLGRAMREARLLALCCGVALLGWQVSGLVEYNFGDGEVRLIALFLMGLLLTLTTLEPAGSPAGRGKGNDPHSQ